jgi:hypothetical protein
MGHVLTYLPKVETLRKWRDENQIAFQGVVKRDWVPTSKFFWRGRCMCNQQYTHLCLAACIGRCLLTPANANYDYCSSLPSRSKNVRYWG